MLSYGSKNINSFNSKNLFIDNINSNSFTISSCPHCNSEDFIKYGKYKNIPRFKCKGCCRTFSMRTNTIWYYSKKKPEIWKEFCTLQLECKSLSYCAKTLNLNIATAFYWRHKFLNVLNTLTETKLLQNHVFMLHSFIKESFKGSKNAPMKSRTQLWMIFSYDSCDNSLNTPYSRHGWRKDNFEKLIYSKLSPKTFISTYGNNFIRAFAQNHNKGLKAPSDNLISMKVQEILYSYQSLIGKTRGIATKYLSQYLALVKAHCLNKTFHLDSILNNLSIIDNKYHIKSHNIKTLDSINF